MYTMYCANHHKAITTLEEVKKKKDFNQFIKVIWNPLFASWISGARK
jgi:hypothetical protein